MPTEKEMDVDPLLARAVHRVVRAMHDGECPKCHALWESKSVRLNRNAADLPNDFDMVCLRCRFTITAVEQKAAMELFAPVMEKNVAVFEEWRATLKPLDP